MTNNGKSQTFELYHGIDLKCAKKGDLIKHWVDHRISYISPDILETYHVMNNGVIILNERRLTNYKLNSRRVSSESLQIADNDFEKIYCKIDYPKRDFEEAIFH